jgi:hypothetical protein
VVAENPVEGFPLRGIGPGRLGLHDHSGGKLSCAGPHQLSVDLDHAGIARLNLPELGMITDVRNFGVIPQKQVDEKLARFGFHFLTIKG